SGVKLLKIFVDGNLLSEEEATCEERLETCPDSLEHEVQLPYQKVGGRHHYRVESEDELGHKSVAAEWEKDVDPSKTLRSSTADPKQEKDCPSTRKVFKQANAASGVIRGSNCGDLIIAGQGVKTIYGRGGNDIILGGPSRSEIHGNAGDDVIRAERSD